jgi:peptidoglycan/LPS O-acetylase OafA/YrhL
MRVELATPLPLEAQASDRLTAPATHSHLALRHYVPALDGVRGLAILVVMFCHFVWIVVEQSPAPDRVSRLIVEMMKTGRYGVDLFFVLSGYLITGILYDAKHDKHYFRNFYARRTLRIFPLYYTVLLIMFVLLPLLGVHWNSPGEQQVVRNQGWLWTYMGNMKNAFGGPEFFHQDRLWMGHFWSLAIEEQFYLVWPTVILFLSRNKAMRLCLGMMIAAPVIRMVLFAALTGHGPEGRAGLDAALYFSFSKLDTLALGAFLALAARGPQRLAVYAKAAPLTLAGTALLLAPLIVLKFDKTSMLGGASETIKLSVICLFSGSLLVLAARSEGRGLAGAFFTNPFMRFLGKYSYGIYIFHELLAPLFNGPLGIARLMPRLGGSWYLAMAVHFVLAFTIAIGVALVSWNVLEKHMLKLKRFFEHEAPRPAAARALEGLEISSPTVPIDIPVPPPAAVPMPTQVAVVARETTSAA